MIAIPGSIKRRLRPLYYRSKQQVVRRFRAYDARDLVQAVRAMGIEPGAGLFVHAGFDAFNGFRGTAADCVAALLEVVEPEGHLLMTSMPYRGSSEAYARSGTVFDVMRTPSAMGMITEVFRRRQDVHRSLSPLHPVLACGARAMWLTADHELLSRSCGAGSPFERFIEVGGKVLFLDASFSSLTFMHYVEDLHRDCFPFELYDAAKLPVRVRDRHGRERLVAQRVFSSTLRARRTFDNVEKALRERGLLHARRLGNSSLMVTDVRDVLSVGEEVARKGGLYV